MTSERLLDELASGLRSVRPRNAWRDGMVIGGLAAVELALFLAMGMQRPDLAHAISEPSFWWKLASLGALAMVTIATALRSFDPSVSPAKGLRIAAWLGAVALLLGWGIDAVHHAGGSFAARIEWREGLACTTAMLILSLPMLIALTLLMRRGAPTDRRDSAMAVALGAAAWGAFVFFFRCGHDDPLYIALWYGGGCVLIALAGRALLPAVTRW